MQIELDPAVEMEIRESVFEFFSEECDVPIEEMADDTHIIDVDRSQLCVDSHNHLPGIA